MEDLDGPKGKERAFQVWEAVVDRQMEIEWVQWANKTGKRLAPLCATCFSGMFLLCLSLLVLQFLCWNCVWLLITDSEQLIHVWSLCVFFFPLPWHNGKSRGGSPGWYGSNARSLGTKLLLLSPPWGVTLILMVITWQLRFQPLHSRQEGKEIGQKGPRSWFTYFKELFWKPHLTTPACISLASPSLRESGRQRFLAEDIEVSLNQRFLRSL